VVISLARSDSASAGQLAPVWRRIAADSISRA